MLMLSPAWLFFAPALLFGLVGSIVFVSLLARTGTTMVEIGGLAFGDHWMILASAMLAIGHQTALFGLAAVIYGLREGYRRSVGPICVLLNFARLEFMLIASFFLMAGGLLIFAQLIREWAATDFGQLSALRLMVGSTTLFLLSLQTFFGGFLLTVIAGNEARLGRGTLRKTANPQIPAAFSNCDDL